MDDITCSQANGILEAEHPPKIVEYDESATAVKLYTECPEKVSECPMRNVSTMTMENALQ